MPVFKIRSRAPMIVLILLTGAGLAALGGCAATQQSSFWADSTYHAAPMNKIMVVAVRKDNVRRRMWEDAFVSEFNDRGRGGTTAIASYQLFPKDLPDTAEMIQLLRDQNFDGVLLVARAQVDTTSSDVAGYTLTEPTTTYSRRWGAYVTRYQDVYYPGYTESEVTVSVRTDLLIPESDGRLVWSVTSQSVDQTSPEQFRSSVADRVTDLLSRNHYIH